MARTLARLTLPALAVLSIAPLLLAGPPNPPAGPVAPTYKTLTEVEPRVAINATNTPGDANSVFKITQAGSYYLTGNIAGVASKTAISVNASRVTIDLNGFCINGGARGVGAVSTDAVVVRNGSIVGTSGTGIDLNDTDHAYVDGVSVYNPGGVGIAVARHAQVLTCRIWGGLRSIDVKDGSIVKGCAFSSSSSHGLYNPDGGCLVSECSAEYCGGDSYFLGDASSIIECTSLQPTVHAIESGQNCLIERCVASYSQNSAILSANGGVIRNCLVSWGNAQGIVVAGACTVVGNQVRFTPTGTAGIWVQGNSNKVEDNHLSSNGYGIYCSGAANLIIRNFARASTTSNYYIIAGNNVGTIVVPGATVGLINGNSGGGLGTADPYANFAN